MKNLISFLLFFVFSGLSAWSSVADGGDLPRSARKGEMYFVEFDLFEALEAFKSAELKAPEHPFILRRIADCYRMMGIPEDARTYYKKAIEAGAHDALDYYYCSDVHQQLGEYEAAAFWMSRYKQKAPEDTRAQRLLNDPRYYSTLESDDRMFHTEALGVNVNRSALPPAQFKELLVLPLATEIENDWFPHRRFLADYDLYQTSIDDKFNLVSAEMMEGVVNTKFLDGPACFDAAREILYVTRFLTKNEKPALDVEGHVYALILSYKMENGEWVEQDIPAFNDDLASSAYPALSPDGSKLFFSSNRKDGKGAMDLYFCEWDEELSEWGTPQRMGDHINTEGNEIYPAFAPDGRFCFASDGHPSLGGLDLFFTHLDIKNAPVENPGIPVNSRSDDFGLVYMGDSFGYFCSNRDGRDTGDDLFWWESMSELIEAEIALTDADGNPVYPEHVQVKNLRSDETLDLSAARGSFKVTMNGTDPYEFAWEIDGEKLVMHCKPEQTPYGLRYVYDSPDKEQFYVDARVESYKESTFRKKKIPYKSWKNLNATQRLDYPSSASAETLQLDKFFRAEWPDIEGEQPQAGSLVFLKDMETGGVRSEMATANGVEFAVNSGHLHAMMWYAPSGKRETAFVDFSMAEDEGVLAFVGDGRAWNLSIADSPMDIDHADPEAVVVASLLASTEGLATAEYAEILLNYVEEGRNVEVVNGSTRVQAEQIFFGFDRSKLSEQEEQKLNAFAQQLNELPEALIEIEAHTDSRGSKTYNSALSRYRAESTREQLVALGVDASRISVVWKGEEEPVNHCIDGIPCTGQQHGLNRRAELFLIIPEAPVPGMQ